jgi:hypothetical protein
MSPHHPRLTHLRHVLLTVLVVLAVWALVQLARVDRSSAQDSPAGIDVVLLVDQSGSMGGSAAGSSVHPAANDTLGLRFEAPQDFIELLAEDRVQLRPDSVHRVAVVYFGDTPTTRLGWTDIAPENWEELRSQLASLTSPEGELAAGPFRESNLGNTDFLEAFQSVTNLFAELPQNETGRVRVILLLTDGAPCVPPPPTPTSAPAVTPVVGTTSPCLNQYAHMQEVQALVNQRFAGSNNRLYVVAMNDSTDDYWKNFGPRWEGIANVTGGWAQKVASNTDVGIVFHDLMKQLRDLLPGAEVRTDTKSLLPGPVVVPPYLDTISFTLFKRAPSETLEIRDANDQVLTSAMDNVETSGENIYTVKVFQPDPGLWRVSTTGSSEDVDIEMRTVAARGHLRSPTGSQVQFVPTTIEWQLLDSRGQALPEYKDARYRLSPSVTVGSDGDSTPVILEYKGDSTYAATFTPTQAGIHTLEMDAIAHDLEGNEVVVFRGPVADFAVGQVSLQPVDLPFTFPQFSALPLAYELRDPSGNPVGVRSGVTVSATVESGAQSWSLPLQTLDSGRFSADFVPIKPGPYTLQVAATTIDPSGQTRVLSKGSGGALTVVPPQFALKSPTGPQAQHLPMNISYQVLTGLGDEWVLAPGYQLDFNANVSFGGQTMSSLPLTPKDATTYEATFTPEQQGTYDLAVTAAVRAPDGNSFPLFEQRSQVSVIPTTRLNLALVHPSTGGDRQYVRSLALKVKPLLSAYRPFLVETQLLDESGQPVDPRSVLRDSPAVPMRLTVVNSETKQDVTDRFTFASSGVPGVFRAEATGLPKGEYVVDVNIPPEIQTQPAYVLLDTDRIASASAKLVENPFWLGIIGFLCVAAVGAIGFSLFKWRRGIALSQHPARGTLQIENEHGAPLATKVLGGRNQLTLKEFHPGTHIKLMEVRCKTDDESKRGLIHFTAHLDDGSRSSGTLMPGPARIPLGQYRVYIRKIN